MLLLTPAGGLSLQRKCACGGSGGSEGECEECKKKTLQRYPAGHAQPAGIPPVVHDVLRSGGQPLDSGTRAFFEPRFGHDFSRVRVHADARAAESARAVNALAYTVGDHIAFASALYDPRTSGGRRLLAHELAHTVQQSGSSGTVQASDIHDAPNSPLEAEAERAAEVVMAGDHPRVQGKAGLRAQRAPDPNAPQHATRTVPGGRIEVTRTLSENACKRAPDTVSTSPSNLLYYDANAGAVGIRYQYCRGNAQAEADSSVSYSLLRSNASQLLQTIANGPPGTDLLTRIQQAAQQGTVGVQAGFALTVSGTLRAEVKGTTDQGTQSKSYDVSGMLRLTPRGWSLELGAEYQHIADASGQGTTITFTPRINVGPVQVGGSVQHTERQPAGGGPTTSTTTVSGTVGVRIAGRTGIILQGSSAGGGTFTINFGTIDQPPAVPQVNCYVCDCPPPTPNYSCTKVTDPTTQKVVTQTPGHEVVELHYLYDKSEPDNKDAYDAEVARIASLAGQNYEIQSIQGFASPEASRAYNLALAGRRAARAQHDISKAVTAAHLSANVPAGKGGGELIGEQPGGAEARNADLIDEIRARLTGLSEEQQFDLLGIDTKTRSDPAAREDARRRIEAFVSGKETGDLPGLKMRPRDLGTRARWEKIFPYLRRVDVTLDRPEVSHPEPVPEKRETGNCDDDTIKWATQNMPEIPKDKKLPLASGRC